MSFFSNYESTNGVFEKTFKRPEPLPLNTIVKASITEAKTIDSANHSFIKLVWEFNHEGKPYKIEQVLFIYNQEDNSDYLMFGAILEAAGYTKEDMAKILNPVTDGDLVKLAFKYISIKIGHKTVKKGWSKENGKYDLPQNEWYKENSVKGIGLTQQAQAPVADQDSDLPF